jgi:hypothetical protein
MSPNEPLLRALSAENACSRAAKLGDCLSARWLMKVHHSLATYHGGAADMNKRCAMWLPTFLQRGIHFFGERTEVLGLYSSIVSIGPSSESALPWSRRIYCLCESPSAQRPVRLCPNQRCATVRPGRLWYGEPDAITNAIGYARFRSRSHNAEIRVYDQAANVIETHEHAGRVRGVVNEAPSQLGRFCRQWISYGSLKNNSS